MKVNKYKGKFITAGSCATAAETVYYAVDSSPIFILPDCRRIQAVCLFVEQDQIAGGKITELLARQLRKLKNCLK